MWWWMDSTRSIGKGRWCRWALGCFCMPRDVDAQGHATLGAVDVCLLLSCRNCASDIDALVRRVTERGRESASFAESRVRKHFADSERAWAIVAALSPQLRGSLVEVNAMQVAAARARPCILASSFVVSCCILLCRVAATSSGRGACSLLRVIAAAQARDVVLQQVEEALLPHLMKSPPSAAAVSADEGGSNGQARPCHQPPPQLQSITARDRSRSSSPRGGGGGGGGAPTSKL